MESISTKILTVLCMLLLINISIKAQSKLVEKTLTKTIDNIYFEVDLLKRDDWGYSYIIRGQNLENNEIFAFKSLDNKYPYSIDELIQLKDLTFDNKKEILILERRCLSIYDRNGSLYIFGRHNEENGFSNICLEYGNYKIDHNNKTLIIDDGRGTIEKYKYLYEDQDGNKSKYGDYYLIERIWKHWKYN